MKTVLIVDNDLGFVFWVGRALDAMHYFAVPAKSAPDAALLIIQLDLKVDLLMINLELSEGSDFVSALHRSQPDIKVIGIVDDPLKPVNMAGVDVTRERPVFADEVAQMEWLEELMAGIQRMCPNHPEHQALQRAQTYTKTASARSLRKLEAAQA